MITNVHPMLEWLRVISTTQFWQSSSAERALEYYFEGFPVDWWPEPERQFAWPWLLLAAHPDAPRDRCVSA